MVINTENRGHQKWRPKKNWSSHVYQNYQMSRVVNSRLRKSYLTSKRVPGKTHVQGGESGGCPVLLRPEEVNGVKSHTLKLMV